MKSTVYFGLLFVGFPLTMRLLRMGRLLIKSRLWRGGRKTECLDGEQEASTTATAQAVPGEGMQTQTNKDSSLLECSCCFESFPIGNMVQCREAHLFCQDCLKKYAEIQIFGVGNFGVDNVTKQTAFDLQCFHGGENSCFSGFGRAALEKALSPMTMQKYDELKFQMSVKKLGLEQHLCRCSKCDLQLEMSRWQETLSCPACHYVSCRSCGKPPHIGMSCKEKADMDKKLSGEQETDVETQGRISVEEAITEAKIRCCPTCKKKFIKTDGCNKIRCGCGTKICYLCRAQIEGYEHFCKVAHCDHSSCNACPLHTNTEQDDKTAMREAGLQAAAIVEEQSKRINSKWSRNQKGLKIDVTRILKDPPLSTVHL